MHRKYCPDLTTIEWKHAMLRGNGDYQSVNLNECIGTACAAYSGGGMCKKYETNVLINEEMTDDIEDVNIKKESR